MDHRTSTPPRHAGSDTTTAPTLTPASEGGSGVFYRASQVLQAQYGVDEMDAYEMMVNEAAAAGTSVREVAHTLLNDSSTPDAQVFPLPRRSLSVNPPPPMTRGSANGGR